MIEQSGTLLDMKKLWISLALTAAACGDDRPPAPTPEQSEQLNDAEAMLNELAKEEGPEDRSPSPSNSQ